MGTYSQLSAHKLTSAPTFPPSLLSAQERWCSTREGRSRSYSLDPIPFFVLETLWFTCPQLHSVPLCSLSLFTRSLPLAFAKFKFQFTDFWKNYVWQNGTAHWENRLAVYYKIKHTIIIWLSLSHSWVFSQDKGKLMYTQKPARECFLPLFWSVKTGNDTTAL